jgi:ankyrin repeat protein
MSENRHIKSDEKKLFTFLRYSWTLDNMIFGEFAEEYKLLNRDDKRKFREKIITQLELYPQNASFIKDYREIEQKIYENSDNAKLNEIYLEEIIELCKTQKKPKRLEIIDDLKICLEKCSDKEILNFFQSINNEIDPAPNDNSNSTNLKRIWEKYKREIEDDYNPETEKILQLDFVLNPIDAVKDENIKLELKIYANTKSDSFLNEVANYAQNLASPQLNITEDTDDFLGLKKFFSGIGETVTSFSDFLINKFTKKEGSSREVVRKETGTTPKHDSSRELQKSLPLKPKEYSSLTANEALEILKEQAVLHEKFIAGTFTNEDKSKLLSTEELIIHGKILFDNRNDEPPFDPDSLMQDHKLIHAILNQNIGLVKKALKDGANSHIINAKSIDVEFLILSGSDDFASEMIKILNCSLFESSPFVPTEPIKSLSPLQNNDKFWNKQYRDGNTALHLALLNNKEKTVQALLETFCIDPKIRNNEGKTVLDLRPEDENFKILLEFFSFNRNSEKIAHFESKKNSPNQKLISAIKAQNYDEVVNALNDGANIYDDYYNIDNLIKRLKGEHPTKDKHESLMIFKFAEDLYGKNANENEQKILEKLAEKRTLDKDLIHAIRKNNLDEVKKAIDNGANINCTVTLTDNSQTHQMRLFSFAYDMANIEKDYRIVNHLLNKGVNYFGLDDLKDDLYEEKMIADLRKNNCEIKSFLNQQNEEGNTLLHLACINNKTQTAKQLIEAGADPTIRNNQNQQAIDLTENLELKSFLLSNELSMRVKNLFLGLRLSRPGSSEPNTTLSPNKSDDSLFKPIEPLRNEERG